METTFQRPLQPSEVATPFVIEHVRENIAPNGHFIPRANLIITSELRKSGLLRALGDRETKSLLLLLTYLTPNGQIRPSVSQLADALKLPHGVVRSRMGRLTAFRWQGDRIVRHESADNGMDGYRLSRAIVAERSAKVGEDEPQTVVRYITKESVIARSRAAYGRSRSDVEADIRRRIDGVKADPDTVPEETEARRRLLALGVSSSQTTRLLSDFPVGEILQQLDWLGDRGARSPARFVVRAIEGRFDPPARVRLERAVAAEEARPGRRLKDSSDIDSAANGSHE